MIAFPLMGKKKGRIEIQPRFKIQYPMKNHNKDALLIGKSCIVEQKIMIVFLRTSIKYKTRQNSVPAGIVRYYL